MISSGFNRYGVALAYNIPASVGEHADQLFPPMGNIVDIADKPYDDFSQRAMTMTGVDEEITPIGDETSEVATYTYIATSQVVYQEPCELY